MSKYTTEVRFICETESGLNESTGFSNVDEVLENSWNKIFTSGVSFFDETYKKLLCKKILKHYYTREIGCESVGLWKLWMNERLELIIPYYNKLYESESLKFDPLNDINVIRTHNRKQDETEKRTTEENSNFNGTSGTSGESSVKENNEETTNYNGNSTEDKKDLYSDTPQGALTGVENETYLTNARKINDSIDSNSSENSESERNTESNYNENKTDTNTRTTTGDINANINTTEDYLESVIGKQGGGSFSRLLSEFRDTFLNIDEMVIERFEDLFFGLW